MKKQGMHKENCDRLVSVYATKPLDGELLTVPFLVPCSNHARKVFTFYKNIDIPDSTFAVVLCDNHANEEVNG